ncbi:MAG: hypothetical protein IT215_00095 [Chitinophagaceae bacterium]|nr:hypothetical protein [Chitinophagaceae bacterium]
MFYPKCLSKNLKDEKYYLTCLDCRFSNSKKKWEKEMNLKLAKQIEKELARPSGHFLTIN